jgi:hypothetical protein
MSEEQAIRIWSTMRSESFRLESMMTVTVPPHLVSTFVEQARRQGVDPDALAADIFLRHLHPTKQPVPTDDWERGLLAVARNCGVSLPDSAVSSVGIYE